MKRITAIATLIFFSLTLSLFTTGCKKDNPNSDGDDDDPNEPVSYSFTDPVNIQPLYIPNSKLLPKAEFVGNHIYIASGIEGFNSNILGYSIGSDKAQIGGARISYGYYNARPSMLFKDNSSLFTVDKNEEYIFSFEAKSKSYSGSNIDKDLVGRVYKVNLTPIGSSGSGIYLNPSADAQLISLGNYDLICMRVDDKGNVYIASLANNGCIVKVSASGEVSKLVSGLISPGFFTIHKGFLYVPLNMGNGKVVKIDQNNGNVTDLITNLTGPANIAIDNYENIVVRSLTTVEGGNYSNYSIYKPDGTLISRITDARGYDILSSTIENMPMYIDNYNNLYFYHADGVNSGGPTGYTYYNPRGQSGIFKISLIKD